MTEERIIDPNITSDDKLWALLAYLFTPLIPIILLLLADKKDRPFLKAHYPQALAFGIVAWVISGLLTPVVFIGCFTWVAGAVFQIIWGVKAYNGELCDHPGPDRFCQKAGLGRLNIFLNQTTCPNFIGQVVV
ncbi:MAG TPA: DUF4870 domain-containing protein [Brevefilum sp.]|nr:DUF4870 domain-containing protein [Brevefilum sp.]HPL68978.1 DUF4870 domain-containing protein [Brevefilum sp.]